MKPKPFFARLLALLFAFVFTVGLVLPVLAQGDLFANFTHHYIRTLFPSAVYYIYSI